LFLFLFVISSFNFSHTLSGIVHEYNGVLELKVSTPYGALTRFELEQVPQEFSGSNSLVSLNLLGSWNTYRIVPDTKPDSVPLDYCGVVSFCGPIRNVMNMDARSGAATSRRIQYRWIKIRDHISNYELCLKVYANCESNWDINFRIDHLRIGMFLLFTDLVISSMLVLGALTLERENVSLSHSNIIVRLGLLESLNSLHTHRYGRIRITWCSIHVCSNNKTHKCDTSSQFDTMSKPTVCSKSTSRTFRASIFE